jgi:hypothetical protein
MATNHGQPAIFADGAPAPPVTSFTSSKSLSWSVDATKAHDMTFVGGASFNGGNGGQSIDGIRGRGEDEQELWKRSEGEGDELRDFKG